MFLLFCCETYSAVDGVGNTRQQLAGDERRKIHVGSDGHLMTNRGEGRSCYLFMKLF